MRLFLIETEIPKDLIFQKWKNPRKMQSWPSKPMAKMGRAQWTKTCNRVARLCGSAGYGSELSLLAWVTAVPQIQWLAPGISTCHGSGLKKKIHARRFLWFRKDPGMTWMKGIIQWDILGFYVDLVTDVSGLFSPRSRQGVLEAWWLYNSNFC